MPTMAVLQPHQIFSLVGQNEYHDVGHRGRYEGVDPLGIEHKLHRPYPEQNREQVLRRRIRESGKHRRQRISH